MGTGMVWYGMEQRRVREAEMRVASGCEGESEWTVQYKQTELCRSGSLTL